MAPATRGVLHFTNANAPLLAQDGDGDVDAGDNYNVDNYGGDGDIVDWKMIESVGEGDVMVSGGNVGGDSNGDDDDDGVIERIPRIMLTYRWTPAPAGHHRPSAAG